MCGVYGITWVDETYVRNMMVKCGHRGPDASSVYTDDKCVTLGHNLLAITDSAHASTQPWRTPKGNVLVYNGEIFNYDELCAKYHKVFLPKTQCDTELLAWGLDEFGTQFVEQIDSQHAFAFWDSQKLTVTLSRDHVGIKPLYYRHTGLKGIEFASEVKALIHGGETVNPMAEACFAYSGLNVTQYSFYNGIYKILPGETVTFRRSEQVGYRRDIVVGTEEDYFRPQEFVEQVRSSVHRCMRGVRQRGIFLSGGMDSAIVGLHAQEIEPGIRTFTSRVSPNPQGGEDYNSDADCARLLAQELGTTHTEVLHTQKDWEQFLDSAWQACEEPLYNWSIPMYQQVNKAMADAGTVITLAGDMGDELTLGYPAYFKFQSKTATHKSFQPEYRSTVKAWLSRLVRPPRIPTKISKDNLAEFLAHGPFKNLQHTYALAAYQRMDQIGNCSEDFFRRNDRLGMLYGMEGRFPWASKQLMTYCMNIDPQAKVELGRKGMTKTAYKDLLPDYIINKSKTGWTAPIQQWRQIPKDQPAMEMYAKWKQHYGIR